MITRRNFIAAALAAPLVPLGSAMAKAVKEQPAKQADFLFVQTAKSISFDKSANKLILEGISPVTLFFSDRPEGIAGNMKTTAFVPFWSTGNDSFLKDPPNADVSILEGDKLRQVVVVLQAPELKGDNLTYTVKALQGEMPAKGADVSVFIDIIGMPKDAPFVCGGRAAHVPASVLALGCGQSNNDEKIDKDYHRAISAGNLSEHTGLGAGQLA
jgi:hypothetical protein